MKNSLTHLPDEKRQELKAIMATIRANPDVEMLILFGSYARGDWLEDRYKEEGIQYHYQSDYDLLAIVKTRGIHKQSRMEIDLMKAVHQLHDIKTPCSIIVHDAHYINAQLEEGQYFFSDIKKEGILLYSTGNLRLKEVVKQLNPEQRYQLAQEDFEYWFNRAEEFFDHFHFSFKKNRLATAAFELHQVTERLYSGILLVFTRYKTKTHDLEILRRLTSALDQRLIKAFPLVNPEEERVFKLLRDAYIDARYKKGYCITKQELNWLSERVQILQQLTEQLCHEKIKSFLSVASNQG
jgi:uncharacterized protein